MLGPACEWPGWQSKIRRGYLAGSASVKAKERDRGAPTMDSMDGEDDDSAELVMSASGRYADGNANTSFSVKGVAS